MIIVARLVPSRPTNMSSQDAGEHDAGVVRDRALDWSAPTEVVLFEVWDIPLLKGYADGQETSDG